MHGCIQGKILSNGSIDKFRLMIVVTGDLNKKKIVVYTCAPTAFMRTLKYFLLDATKHEAKVLQLDFIWAFMQAKVKNRVFVKLDSWYADYFP